MIFVEKTTEEWIKKYQDLSVLTRECDNCGSEMKTTKPFISKDYAGLKAPKCSCGKNKFSAMSMVTRTSAKYNEFANDCCYL